MKVLVEENGSPGAPRPDRLRPLARGWTRERVRPGVPLQGRRTDGLLPMPLSFEDLRQLVAQVRRRLDP